MATVRERSRTYLIALIVMSAFSSGVIVSTGMKGVLTATADDAPEAAPIIREGIEPPGLPLPPAATLTPS